MKYYSFNQYCLDTFGHKLYKLSVDAGMTCPNRDGTAGTGGCIFCSGGSGEFAESGDDIVLQLENAKKRVSAKYKGQSFIAYLQSYSNTYAPVEKLRVIYERAMSPDFIEVLDVATRPDCVNGEVVALLSGLSRVKPVWAELGLQTSRGDTARLINRCYPNDCYLKAAAALKAAGIPVITHIIFGLPGESREDMLESVRFACDAGTDGIKLHCLYVSRGTPLARMYEAGEFECLDEETYTDLVADALGIIPPDVVIHRMTGDGDKKTLVAPMWTADKKHVLNLLKKKIESR